MPRHDRRRAGAAMLVLLAASAVTGCSRQPASSEPGTINFLIETMPANLDPRIGSDAVSQHLHGLIFSGLVARDAQMNFVPDLAVKWETPDDKTFVFHLRPGVRFHNGAVLTSADVKFTFDSIMNGAITTPKRASFPMVASVEAPNPATVVFHLSEPYASFLWDISRPGVGIVPSGSDAHFAEHPIGTGPFRFVSAIPDQEIVLERSSDYFGTAPSASRVRFRVVPDATVRALELRKGSADIEINSLTPDMIVALKSYPGIAVTEQAGTSLAYIAFNFEDPLLRKPEVRQALAYATDRQSLIRYLLRGQARVASSLLPPNHWAFNPNVRAYEYNAATAEKILDDAGLRRGGDGVRIHLTLKTSTDESTRLLAEALQDQWRRVGVALEVRPLEFATFTSDITHGSFQLYSLRWVGGNNDPDIFEFVFSSRKFPPNGQNRGHYSNPQLDALLDRARVEMSREKRKETLAEVQQIVGEDLPYLMLWYVDNVSVHRDRLSITALGPGGDYDFLDEVRAP